jgi:lysophospholipase L1-like esterase
MFKKLTLNILLFIFSILVTCFALEIGLRLYQVIKYQTLNFSTQSEYWQRASLDTDLGWKNKENYSIEKTLADAKGNEYIAKVHSSKYGFKVFGNNNSNNRILIVGDSFTDGNEVSNNKTFWGILADNFKNLDFYVYGGGGYGNLQEYLIIDKYIDEIKPQFLLLQFCSNDFINNDYTLESNSNRNNNGLRRPYINSSGTIFYNNPKHLRLLPEFLIEYSRLFHLFNYNVEVLYYLLKQNQSVENDIERMGATHEGFRHSAELTKIIMQKIKKRALGVKIYAFCVDYKQPYYDEFKQLAKSEGFTFIDGIPQAIEFAENSGQITRAADKGHWNELGHKIAGEKILEYFLNHGFDQYR